jgi:hypothetical protein
MVAQPYVDGITDTVSHRIASSLTAGQVESMDVCTGEVTIRGAGQLTASATPLTRSSRPGPAPRALTTSSTITGHRHISLYPAGSSSNCTRQSRELRS